jgi:DNA-binding LacI/PurR family transcriptional regulator
VRETPNRSDTISSIVVVASHDHGYYSRAIEMAFRYAQERELDVTFEPPNFERIGTLARTRGSQIGLLVIGSQNVHDVRQLSDTGCRIVGVGDWRLIERIPFPCVFPDNVRGGYMAAAHLIEIGHAKLAYLAAGDNPRLWGHEHAVRHAQEAGQGVRSVVIDRDTFNEWQRNPSLAKTFFAAPDSPTGFCTWNDTDAISLMTLLMSIGLHVPNDISIVGYDNLPVTETITPALTTIDTHLEDQVKLAIAQLVSQNELPHHSIVVDPDLIVRASTKPR